MAGIYEVVRKAADQAIRETALDDILSEHRKLRAALEAHKHTDECLEYAAKTGRPFCIAECADARRAVLAEVGER